jgi:DNA-binding CsgD family transcriptional regulator
MQFNRKYKLGGADVFCFYGRQHDLYPVFLTHWITADETVYGESYGVIKNYRRQQQRNDYLNLRNAMAEKHFQKQHKTMVFCIVALAALLLIIGALLFWLKRKPKTEIVETQPEAPKPKIQTPEPKQPEENPFVKQELTNHLRLILAAARIEKNAYDPKMEWKPLVRQVMNGKETAFESAVSVIEAAYPGLQAMIAEQYPELNETDAKVCLLSCSGLTNTEMGDLLGLSVHSINKSRSELRKKLGFEPDELKDKL